MMVVREGMRVASFSTVSAFFILKIFSTEMSKKSLNRLCLLGIKTVHLFTFRSAEEK